MPSGFAAHSTLARLCTWGGATVFVISLAYFLFTYAITFGVAATGPVVFGDVAWNLALFTAFALHHSVFARTPIRAQLARLVPPGLERSLYVWLASLLLIVVCASWRPIPGVAWHIDGALAWPLYAMQLAGIWLSLRSAAIIDVGELAGLKAANVRDAAFEPTGPYGWVRHPIYAGWFLMVFAVPVMTFTRLEFALISAAYILIAIPLEERTLRATAGESYAKYSALVRWKVVPGVY